MRKDGTPCKANAWSNGLCFGHQPVDRTASAAKGGYKSRKSERASKLLPARLLPLVETLERIFYQLERGERDVKEATAMASIAIAIGKLIQTGEIEERTRELERQAREAMARPEKWA
jgi:hypothetical protein